MTAGRPIGARIRQICEVLEKTGPLVTKEICARLPNIEQSNAGKYCSRAVGLGLMTVNRVHAHRSYYAIVDNWRELIEQRRTTKPIKPPRPLKRISRWDGVSSIFQMGGNP